MESTAIKESLVTFQGNQGMETKGSMLRMGRYAATFDIYGTETVLRTSEVLGDFKITWQGRTLYSGRAIVRSFVNTGTAAVCEVTLEDSWLDVDFAAASASGTLGDQFRSFIGEWQKLYRVRPEFKVIVADMQTFLTDLRLWLDQVELGIRSAPIGDRNEIEQETLQKLGDSIVPAFDAMHEQLENLSSRIDEELRPAHQNFAKRQLHPLMLCSPFAYRTYHKPLGYAGDYEMVNMIARNPFEGGSVFAKVVNLWFLSQWPAKAHRNRIEYLKEQLVCESLRGARRGRPIRVLNLGCGPAREIQLFFREPAVCNHAQFVLWDFNDETIRHTADVLEQLKRETGCRASVQIQKKSVHQVLKEGSRTIAMPDDQKYDLIYCAGLFDYLADRTCKQLMNIFYDRLGPGGLLLATNVADRRPFRHMLEFVLDWHLIYRDAAMSRSLRPDSAPAESERLKSDATEVNLFIEVRKPEHA